MSEQNQPYIPRDILALKYYLLGFGGINVETRVVPDQATVLFLEWHDGSIEVHGMSFLDEGGMTPTDENVDLWVIIQSFNMKGHHPKPLDITVNDVPLLVQVFEHHWKAGNMALVRDMVGSFGFPVTTSARLYLPRDVIYGFIAPLCAYVGWGQIPGERLHNILCGELYGGVLLQFDEVGLKSLGPLLSFIDKHLPTVSFGSRDKVEKWGKGGGMRGRRIGYWAEVDSWEDTRAFLESIGALPEDSIDLSEI